MTRIKDLNCSMLDVVTILSDGNPGAISVMMDIIVSGKAIDPDDMLAPLGALLSFDTHEIYGPDIWVFYKDLCGQDLMNMLGLLRSVQLGIAPEHELKAAIRDNYMPQERVAELVAAVQERLPQFGACRAKAHEDLEEI